ncbi:MAG: protein phosphatase 2C domain-containing protein [Pseudomonadota bacterium]|jgi:serine/threonine protein phosphatase PrpC
MIVSAWLRRKPRAPQPKATLRSEGRTHVGRVRTVNEDRLLDRADRGLWAVADGMGGHSAGAAAAATVVTVLDALADDLRPIDEARVREALTCANRTIHDRGSAHVTSGATVVAALVVGETATICWAGDSRAYRIRDGRAERLTRDHSVVQEMIDAGVLSEAAAERHPQANVVTRALGVTPTIAVDSVAVTLAPGDRLLLCSDGVSRSIDPRDFVTMPEAIGDIADRFLANALQRDGGDNTTLVVVAVQ